MSSGFRQITAAAQQQCERAGGLVRASDHGPAKEEADGRGGFEKMQGASKGHEDQPRATERGHPETGAAKILSAAEAHSDGKRETSEHHTTQGTMTDMQQKDAQHDLEN